MNVNAESYDHLPVELLIPKLISSSIYVNFHVCTLSGLFNQNNILSEAGDITEHGEIFIPRLNPVDLDYYPPSLDNNERAETIGKPSVDVMGFKICKYFSWENKISLRDQKRFKQLIPLITQATEFSYMSGLAKLQDQHTMIKLQLSAAPYNMGANAGRTIGGVNLGTQNQNALPFKTREEILTVFNNIDTVLLDADSWKCGSDDIVMSLNNLGSSEYKLINHVYKPLLIMPLEVANRIRSVFIDAFMQKPCCPVVNRAYKVMGDLFDYTAVSTKALRPMNINGVRVAPIILCNPNTIANPLEEVYHRPVPTTTADIYSTEYMYDTLVLEPNDIIVAYVKL